MNWWKPTKNILNTHFAFQIFQHLSIVKTYMITRQQINSLQIVIHIYIFKRGKNNLQSQPKLPQATKKKTVYFPTLIKNIRLSRYRRRRFQESKTRQHTLLGCSTQKQQQTSQHPGLQVTKNARHIYYTAPSHRRPLIKCWCAIKIRGKKELNESGNCTVLGCSDSTAEEFNSKVVVRVSCAIWNIADVGLSVHDHRHKLSSREVVGFASKKLSVIIRGLIWKHVLKFWTRVDSGIKWNYESYSVSKNHSYCTYSVSWQWNRWLLNV